MRTRIGQLTLLRVGEAYGGSTIKSLSETTGAHTPTKAYYDDGKSVMNQDQLIRIVLINGMIHYRKKGTYRV